MEAEGARTFQATGDAYDLFMGRYSRSLAGPFADAAGVVAGQRVLDVGCGPGALTAELVQRVGAASVDAIDPSPSFVEACATRFPGVGVRVGHAEQLPFADESFDRAAAQLVVHFMSDPEAGAGELRRVLRPGGVAAACIWDADDGMQMLGVFRDAAMDTLPHLPHETHAIRFGREGELTELFDGAGFAEVVETVIEVQSTYSGVDELWAGFCAGVGPPGALVATLDDAARDELKAAIVRRIGSPSGPFTLRATARCVTGTRART